MSNMQLLPSNRGQFESFVQNWMAQRQAKEQREAELAQQQKQFDASNALDTQRTNAQVENYGATTRATNTKTDLESATARVEGFLKNVIAPLDKNGRHDLIPQLTKAFIASNPGTEQVLAGYLAERPALDSDTTAANTQKFAANQTGIAASGSQDAQARNFATKEATGEQLNAPAFADQRGRQMNQPGLADKGTEYGKEVRVAGGLTPDAGDQLKANTEIQVGRERNATTLAASAASGASDEAKKIADAIVSGKQPPNLGNRLTGTTAKVRAALADQGYDLSKATEDWNATQKYLSTLNGTQQVRLRQAVDFTYESIGAVEKLASAWDAGGFPVLNKARLAAAKQGALGPEAQSIATRMESAINDSVSELATVYKGGNSSTDEGLKLAAANLKTDWSKGTLLDNAAQIKEFLGYRRNSMSSGHAVTNQGNVYAPNTAGETKPANVPPAETKGKQLSKTQTNTATGAKRTVFSDDGGATWHP